MAKAKDLMIDLGDMGGDAADEEDTGAEDRTIALDDAAGAVSAAFKASDNGRLAQALADFIDIHMG